MKFQLSLLLLSLALKGLAQPETGAQQFWNTLKSHCGKSYEGVVLEAPVNDDFRGKKLVMHLRSCGNNIMHIPFFVGEDKSRTWVFRLQDGLIQLKHDHSHKDGTRDAVTEYGGMSTNSGLPNIQFFPADQQTADLIPLAATNVWWITIDETSFTYNLRRLGTDRLFSIKFDLTKPVATPPAPWGWVD